MEKVKLITTQLGNEFIRQIESSTAIYILTSFVMKSGINYIKDALVAALKRGADIKICTGDYFYITQPEALEELLKISEKIEIRLWKSEGISFHPKAYLFEKEDGESIIVGSSNLSSSALTTGVEWNISVSNDKQTFEDALEQFFYIFYAESTVPLNQVTLKEYRKHYENYHIKYPNLAKEWSKGEEIELMLPIMIDNEHQIEHIFESRESYGEIKPRFAQIEALEELKNTLVEGYTKALVVMATGLGKTYLAGFFAKNFNRVLFIAHREEILVQAKNSFSKIMPNKNFGILNGKKKEVDVDIIFASIFTLSIKKYLHLFEKDEFDLIIIDEFHHAAAKSYKKVIDYFKPKFLLGITATPDRNDHKDIYAICEGNVAYKIDFLEAIDRKWLSSFKYYGVYDDTDYTQIKWLGNRYDEQELLQVQLRDELAEKIYYAWKKRKQTRTLGFCSSIKQADFLSKYFNSKGCKTVSLHSKQLEIGRQEAINNLKNGTIDIIFTVDLFNEGIDIPEVDTLLFVRPTESLTVFTQQIGRGLRLYHSKKHCVIIDLIGNYRNADIKLSLFDKEKSKRNRKSVVPVVPEICEIHLDVKVINLIEEMTRKRQPRKEKLYEDYLSLKMELGRRPSYLELHLYSATESSQYRKEFQSYFGFLNWAKELSDEESKIYEKYKKWFLNIEKTQMTKSYKMVLLLAMLERGPSNWFEPIRPQEAAPFFHKFLMGKEYRIRKDFSDKRTKRLWEYDEEGVSRLISTMPMTKWSSSSDGLINFNNGIFCLTFDVNKEDEKVLFEMTKEICEYRIHTYFERAVKK